MKVSSATNHQGDSRFFAMLDDWERDSLPDLPRPRDFAEYERAVCEQQGLGMRTIYRDPIGEL